MPTGWVHYQCSAHVHGTAGTCERGRSHANRRGRRPVLGRRRYSRSGESSWVRWQSLQSRGIRIGDLTGLRQGLEIRWEYPPNPKVRAALTDTLSEGVSFYATLAGVADRSLVQFGVIDLKWRPDDPLHAYFSVHSFPPANVLALGMAIAAAQLAGSKIEDGSSHWLAEEMNEPSEALTKFRLPRSPSNLNSALSQIDELLNWKKRPVS